MYFILKGILSGLLFKTLHSGIKMIIPAVFKGTIYGGNFKHVQGFS